MIDPNTLCASITLNYSELARSILGKISLELFRTSRLPESRREFFINIWSIIMWAILKHWVLNGKKEIAEELVVIALHSLPRPY